jgi:hypothetical protein
MMTPNQQAAALWGIAENEAFPTADRLKSALAALEHYGNQAAWLEEMLECENELIFVVDDYHTNPEYRTDTVERVFGTLEYPAEEWAVQMMEIHPDRFNFFIVKEAKVPVDV